MAKIVRLTESDLTRLVKRVIRETNSDMPRKSRGIMGHKDSWFDDMDRPTNPDEFEHDEEIEFGPDDYDEYLNHTSDIENKWPFVPDTEAERRGYGNPGKSYFDRYTKDAPLRLRKKRSMDESEEEPSDEETKKLVDYFWDSMTTGEKRRLMTKVDKERKEKGLPSLRPKSSRIMKKDK
jgi:hypothetical protein